MNFAYKNKKETDKNRKHIDVFINNTYVGFIISEVQNKFASDNWYFVYSYDFTTFKQVPENFKIQGSISHQTKKELINLIENLPNL
jgi:hypothetical protein